MRDWLGVPEGEAPRENEGVPDLVVLGVELRVRDDEGVTVKMLTCAFTFDNEAKAVKLIKSVRRFIFCCVDCQ